MGRYSGMRWSGRKHERDELKRCDLLNSIGTNCRNASETNCGSTDLLRLWNASAIIGTGVRGTLTVESL